MRTAIAAALSLALVTGAALAQSAPPTTTGAIGKENAKAAAAKKTADGIAECMKLWDAKTHMTKGEWARTCQRVQTRLENLKVDSTLGLPKAVERKRGKGG